MEGPDTEGVPFRPGNDDDCADYSGADSAHPPSEEPKKSFAHKNVCFISLSSITILNATHGKKIGVIFDGCVKGTVPVFGVNFTYGCDKNGVTVLSSLAVKPCHCDL